MNKIEKEVISPIFQKKSCEAELDEIFKQVTETSLTTVVNFTEDWKVHKYLLEKKLNIQFHEYCRRCFNYKRQLPPSENQTKRKQKVELKTSWKHQTW